MVADRDRDELVIHQPSSDAMVQLGQIINDTKTCPSSVKLMGCESCLNEIAAAYQPTGLCLTNSTSQAGTRGNDSDIPGLHEGLPDSGAEIGTDTTSKPTSRGPPESPDIESITVTSPHRDNRTPSNFAGSQTTDDWLRYAAESLGVSHDALSDIVRTHFEGAVSNQTRHLLELAFTHHLERTNKGENAHITIQIAGDPAVNQYHYLDNGPRRGGAHLLRGLTPQLTAEIHRCASSHGLTVIAEGHEYLSLSFERPAIKPDIQFTERIITDVLDASMADIVRIEEVIDRDETRTWLG